MNDELSSGLVNVELSAEFQALSSEFAVRCSELVVRLHGTSTVPIGVPGRHRVMRRAVSQLPFAIPYFSIACAP